ncbi:MAG: hypothetical protein PVG27_07735, partial [Chloroflexota bacterium]
MAGWAPARPAAFTWISHSVVLVLLIATTAGQSVLAQSRQTSDGLPVGVPVTYESPDGSESLTLTVEEVIDPYDRGLTDYDQDRLASETKRYVGVRLMIGNDAPEPLPYFFTSHIVIDAGATRHQPRSIQRDRETAAADPGLKAGEVTAGGSISGLLFYELPEAAEVEMILFAPSPDRLITLSSHGGQPDVAASATEEPTMTATEAPTTEAPTTEAAAPTASGTAPTAERAAPTAVAAILRTGFPVPYRSLDGSTSMLLTVEEIIDPYEAVKASERARLSDEERRYVALRLSLENSLETPIPLFFPHGIKLLDTDTVLHTPGFAPRDSEAQAADPNLPSGEIGAGATISGLLFYELSATAEPEEVIFLPSDDRLIKLATREPPRATLPDGADADDVAWADDASGSPPRGPDIIEIAAKGAYHSAIFGYGLRWDPSLWTVREASAEPDHDRLVLGSGTVSIEVDGLSDLEGDARRCLIDRVYGDLDVASGFDAAPVDVLPPTRDDQFPPTSGLYLLVHDDEDGGSDESVRYVECRRLPGNAGVLRLVMSAPTPRWIAERGMVIDVRSATTLPDRPPPSATQEAAGRL